MSKPASDQDQANLIRPEHSGQSVHVDAEQSGFTVDSPASIPKLHVPGLSPDATSVPPEALSGNVPTLTDPVLPEDVAQPELAEAKLASMPAEPIPVASELVPIESQPALEDDPEDEQTLPALSQEEDPEPQESTEEALAQELAPEADTWVDQMQVRIGKLTEEIHMLNDRLDRFEKLPKV